MERIIIYTLAIFFTCSLNNLPAFPGADAIGINYGLLGNNLPPPAQTIARLQEIHVNNIRLFFPDKDVLTALHDSGISVIIGTFNDDLLPLASDPSAAAKWVETHILPHAPHVRITCIAAGNEVFPSDLAQHIPNAMKNLDAALTAAGLSIPVSTAVSLQVLSASSYPPSSGAFSESALPIMTEIAQFLSSKRGPILVNVYPYFARASDSRLALDYALFKDGDAVVPDGAYTYRNAFDAMTDTVYSALEKVGGSEVEIVVTETGWPTAGGVDASVENARVYVNNLIGHVSKGTPKRPGKEIETYIFAMYNENQKPEGVEQNWGLYYPDLTEVYHVDHF